MTDDPYMLSPETPVDTSFTTADLVRENKQRMAILAITTASRAMPAIAKDTHVQFKSGERYSVRGWDDIVDICGPILAAHGLVFHTTDLDYSLDVFNDTPIAKVSIGCNLFHRGGGCVTGRSTAVARFRGNDPIGAARTYAARTWFCRTFMIRTNDVEPDIQDAAERSQRERIG